MKINHIPVAFCKNYIFSNISFCINYTIDFLILRLHLKLGSIPRDGFGNPRLEKPRDEVSGYGHILILSYQFLSLSDIEPKLSLSSCSEGVMARAEERLTARFAGKVTQPRTCTITLIFQGHIIMSGLVHHLVKKKEKKWVDRLWYLSASCSEEKSFPLMLPWYYLRNPDACPL